MATKLVTVFGGSGFIGRHLVGRLAASGAQIRVAVRHPDAATFLKPMGDVGQITPVQANVRQADSVRAALDGADAVVNLVGILSESRLQRFDAVHRDGAAHIAQSAIQTGVKRLVHLSSLGASTDSTSHYALREYHPSCRYLVVRFRVLLGAGWTYLERAAPSSSPSMLAMSPLPS